MFGAILGGCVQVLRTMLLALVALGAGADRAIAAPGAQAGDARALKRFEKRSAPAMPMIEAWADGTGPELPLTKEDEDWLSLYMKLTFSLWERDQAIADASDLLAAVPVPEAWARAPYVARSAYGENGRDDDGRGAAAGGARCEDDELGGAGWGSEGVGGIAVGAGHVRAVQPCVANDGVADVDPPHIGRGEVAAVDAAPVHHCLPQMGASERAPLELAIVEGGTRQIGLVEVAVDEPRISGPHVPKVRSMEVPAAHLGADDRGTGADCSWGGRHCGRPCWFHGGTHRNHVQLLHCSHGLERAP